MNDYMTRKAVERAKSYWRQVGETVIVSLGVCAVLALLALMGIVH